MRIRRIDRKLEKDILIGMITDKTYLSYVRPILNLAYFKNPYCRTIAKWVMDFYDKYGEPPFNEIQKIYDYNERQGNVEEDEVDLIKTTLEMIAEEYAECPTINSQFLLGKTEEYFNRVSLETIFSQAMEFMQNGDVEKAIQLVHGSSPIRISGDDGTDGLTSQAEIQEAFERNATPLFRLPGDVGKLINDELCRDKFLALQAPEKTGKTWFLMWLAMRALRARLKVVLFEFEMTKPQVNLRLSISISGKSNKPRYCKGARSPVKFSLEGEKSSCLPDGIGVEYEDFDLGDPLTWQEALESNEKFYERFKLKKEKHWRLFSRPARSMNISDIKSQLDRLEKEEDFVADVVLIDYIDILSPEPTAEKEDRNKLISNWIAAKGLSNEKHQLVVTVTQANAQTYGLEVQTKSSFAEDHRKYAHTNGTLGLTQTPEDKKNGIAKLNWLVIRESDWGERDICYILQCLKRGRFCVDSMIPSEVERREGVKLGPAKKNADQKSFKKRIETKQEDDSTPKKRKRSTRDR